jgi:hypothetical protein
VKKRPENIGIAKTGIGKKFAITLPILLLALSIIIFLHQIPMVAYNYTKIYDKDFVTVLREIGNDVPEGSSIIASANGPQLAYFSGHKITIPRGVDSFRSLVGYMWKHNSNYLVAFEGKSSVDDLQPLFTRSGITKLLSRSFDKSGA